MTKGQYRVLVLLIILALLEVAIYPQVKDFFKNLYASIGESISRSKGSL